MRAEPGGGTDPRLPLGGGDDTPPVLDGRYELGLLLGRGATSRVYRATDRRLSREVAVKVFDRDAVPADRARRMREMAIHGGLDHPAVVPLYDCGTHDGWTYLVMKLVDGQNLAERLLAGPLPADEVSTLADRLAGALAHLHAQGVTHRDLKPANVLLGPDGPVIVDFGIAHTVDSTRVTKTGTAPGTVAYMAPEQVAGELAGPSADVYALGLLLLECLTAEREYPGTLMESAMARLTRPPRIPAALPVPLAAVITRMTAREPGDRPAAETVQQLLRNPEHVTLPPTEPLVRRRRGKRAPLAIAGLMAVAAAILVPFLLSGTTAQDTPAPPSSPSAGLVTSSRPAASSSSARGALPAGQPTAPRTSSTVRTSAPPSLTSRPAGSSSPAKPSVTSTETPTNTQPATTTAAPSQAAKDESFSRLPLRG